MPLLQRGTLVLSSSLAVVYYALLNKPLRGLFKRGTLVLSSSLAGQFQFQFNLLSTNKTICFRKQQQRPD